MHNEAMKSRGIEGCYLPFEVKPEDIPAAVSGLKALRVKGVNVTIPHKQAVIECLDELDPVAEAVGAVNTIKFEGTSTLGYNTDGAGFLASLKRDAGWEIRGKKVLVIGAGGAARGLSVKLALEGASGIEVTNRTPEKGEALVRHLQEGISYFSTRFIPMEPEKIRDCLSRVDIVINSTSVGMGGGNQLPISPEGIESRHLVCDIVYTPLKTAFIRECKKKGAAILNGLGMLIYQGDLAFQIWTGKSFPCEKIRRILTDKLQTAKS